LKSQFYEIIKILKYCRVYNKIESFGTAISRAISVVLCDTHSDSAHATPEQQSHQQRDCTCRHKHILIARDSATPK